MIKHLQKPYMLIVLYTLLSMVILWPAQAALIREGRDIRQDYIGSQRLLGKLDLYTPFSQVELTNIKVEPELGMDRNYHPPTTLIFFVPLALLNFHYAVIMWGMFSLFAFFISVYLIMHELGYEKWFYLSLVMVFWYPLWLHIRFGQFSTLTFLFLTLFWISVKQNRERTAGFFLALACLVKVFPMFIFLLLILKKQWRILLYSLLILSIVIIPLYLYHPDSVVSFLTQVAPDNNETSRTYFGNFSLNGFIGRLFNGTGTIAPLFSAKQAEPLLRYSGLILVTFLAVIFALRVNNYDLCLSVYIVVMLIASPITWAHGFVILLIPGFVILRFLPKPINLLGKFIFVIVLILSCTPHWHYYEWLRTISPGQPLPGWLLFTSPGFYVLIGMLILTVAKGSEYNAPHPYTGNISLVTRSRRQSKARSRLRRRHARYIIHLPSLPLARLSI